MGGKMEQTGRIHSFESFGTVDGPGIRFVIFMQGCPLRCLYCHNPDTWHLGGGSEYTVDEVMQKIRRYLPYIESSGGGITVSGGEPLLQPDFLLELFRRCREENIHTAIDTSGCAAVDERAAALLEYTDLVLLDIKHINKEMHKKITGASNSLTLDFARALDSRKIPVWLRYVVVPGLTDDEISLKRLAEFLKSLSNVEKIELLPFHKLGEYKWKELGLDYTLGDVREATEGDIARVRKILS